MKTTLTIGSIIFSMVLAFSSVIFAQSAIDTSAFGQKIRAAEIKLKENPIHEEIIRIYKSINRKPPKPGVEPPPLPFIKTSQG